jgi:cytochrome P450
MSRAGPAGASEIPSAFDPRDPAFLADPFPVFRALRARAPVHWCEALNGYVLTRHAEVKPLLGDPRLSADRITPFAKALKTEERRGAAALIDMLTRWAVFKDPPDHTRIRRLLNAGFTPKAIDRLAPDVKLVVDRLLDGAAEKGRMDLIGDFSYPLPATVIAILVGAPARDIDLFKKWSDDMAGFVGSALSRPNRRETAAAAARDMARYFRDLVAERRARPGQDIIDELIAARDEGGSLSEDELVATSVLLLFAGHETTTHLIANGMMALLDHPGEFDRLRAGPALLPRAVEEMLRYDGPVMALTRVARVDMEIAESRVAAGDLLFLMVNSANRDPAAFPDPDMFDCGRDAAHLAFGFGPHYCLGAPLARLEARIAFDGMLGRFKRIEAAGPAPEWLDTLVLRGMRSFEIRWDR